MNIASTQYTYSTRSLDIYVSGCKAPHCKGCHNSELFDFDLGVSFDHEVRDSILNKIKEFDLLIKNVFIYGGEPLDQDLTSLKDMLLAIKTTGKVIWLFTKYDLSKVPVDFMEICDYIKCGRYDESLLSSKHIMYGVNIASTNQTIYKKGKDY